MKSKFKVVQASTSEPVAKFSQKAPPKGPKMIPPATVEKSPISKVASTANLENGVAPTGALSNKRYLYIAGAGLASVVVIIVIIFVAVVVSGSSTGSRKDTSDAVQGDGSNPLNPSDNQTDSDLSNCGFSGNVCESFESCVLGACDSSRVQYTPDQSDWTTMNSLALAVSSVTDHSPDGVGL
jgi:energy-converting hydrogenase Eha subunit C